MYVCMYVCSITVNYVCMYVCMYVILADKGFDIDDSVAAFYAEVKIPDFTGGKKQLAQLEVDGT